MFEHGWVAGHGRVVEVLTSTKLSGDGLAASEFTDDYIMDIYPESGEPFRAKVRNAPGHSIFALREALNPGDIVGVKCDPKAKKARLDGSDPTIHAKEMWAKHPSEQDRRKAILEQPPLPDPLDRPS